MFDALTQGRTRREALEMVKDWLETAVNRGDFHATVHEKGRAEFEVSGSDATSMVALLLRRRRAASGASLRDMASRLGSTSRNAYARYERGEAAPTIEKLDALLKATSPGGDFVIRETQ
jgi:ribosome-binding protein aMBF1 (putative translation factor)